MNRKFIKSIKNPNSIPFSPCTTVYDRHLQSYRPLKLVAMAVAKEKFTKNYRDVTYLCKPYPMITNM